MVKELMNKDELNDFIKDEVCLVDFFATWCGPCKMLAPVVEKLSESGVKCGKMDIDDNAEVAMKYGIEVIPYVVVFKKGQPVDKSIGLVSLEELQTLVEKNK